MVIDAYSIGGYFGYYISGQFIGGYWWLLMLLYQWLLVAILLMVIGVPLVAIDDY